MELKDIKSACFAGASGIGVSTIARYFLHKELRVAGYDKIPSKPTHTLEKEGMDIHYGESAQLIPIACREPASTLAIYAPAISSNHAGLVYFRENGSRIQKHAQTFGTLTRTHKGLYFAETHGKTTTSSICAYLMHQSHLNCSAFLGSISKNYGTNYILSDYSDFVVIEVDELDRPFH